MFDEFDKTFGGVFPSPIGELHFSIMTGGTMGVEFVMFPSPIGELHFSMKLYLDNCHIYITFPSPIGELHFSIFSLNSTKLFPQRFPSPIGELHFSIAFSAPLNASLSVSVPYRGATFLNYETASMVGVSIREFPSPIGELHFSILTQLFLLCFQCAFSFRPLSGSYISQC